MQTPGRTAAWAAAALLVASAALAAEAAGERPGLVVLWSDPQRCVAEAVRGDLARETEALFARWGIEVTTSWADTVDRTRGSVRVVLLDRERLDASGRRVLGETHAAPQDLPAVWILVPNVRAILRHGDRGDSPLLLARALARVAAHEIGHALGIGHSRKGLMRCRLGAAELTRPWIQASDALGSDLRDALRPRARVARGRP